MSKKTCVACGNTGNIPHRVNVGGVQVVVCGTCLGEAHKLLSLSTDDSPVTVAAKLLALRNPRKEAPAVKRMQETGVDVSWEEAARQAEFFRAQVRKRREQVRAEVTARNRAWLDELEGFLEKEVGGRGLEWEIHDWLRAGRNAYVVKIGIYPWGTTFLEGTLGEIREYVFEILREVESRKWRCPFCGAELGWREVTVQGKCACGARFRQSTCRSACGSVHENNAWEEIEARILPLLPERDRDLHLTLLGAGAHVQDLFGGVAYLGSVFGWPTYAVRGKLRVKSREEISQGPANALRVALWETGFSPRVCTLFRRRIDWWEGSVDGIRLYVCPSHPEHDGLVARVEAEDVPLRRDWLSLPTEESDELHEAWTEWLMVNGDDGDYTVTDSLLVSDHEWGEGFVWEPRDARSRPVCGWMEVLRRGLEVYGEKVKCFLSEFSRRP